MFKLISKILVIFLFFTVSTRSQEFDNVLINGNVRISNETILVFSELPSEQFLDENSINTVLKKLYESGFFKDVVVKIENRNLIIDVIENPIIQTVFVEGIKKKKTIEAIYDILLLKNRSSFNSITVKNDERIILNFLKNDGYYFPEVISSIQELGDNKIDLFYNINTGEKAKIAKISFIGDKKYKDSTLRDIILSEEYKFWKFISGKKFLNENLINYDKRLLDNFYKNKGYYDTNIESSFANYLGNDKFELIYNIYTGKKYYFNDLTLELPIDYDEVNFKKLNSIFANLKGKKYSINSIDKIIKEIDKIVLNEQYEFLKSSVDEQINGDLINLTFKIEESEKFYVEKINIFGNNITQENVLRNNLSTDEGDAFNELLHKRTINNLKSLNFFSDVKSEILDGTLNNQKIINITVEEKPTGEISAGAGIGTSGGSVAFGVKENNFLGKGIEFGSDLSISGEAIKGSISISNPNYKGTDKSLNFKAESTTTDRLANFGYKSMKKGFSLGSGSEFYEDLFLNVGVSTFHERLSTTSTASTHVKKQDGSYFDAFVDYTLAYDKRNQKYKPSEGFTSKFTQKLPVINKSNTITNVYELKLYEQFFDQNVLSYGFYGATTNSLTNKDVKLSDRLFIPQRSLRGFESGRIGPKDGPDYIGGNYALTFNANTTLPQVLPSFENTNFSLFFDAANLWGVDYTTSNLGGSKIRSAVGLAVDLYTPIGPLTFSFAEPITKGKNDITETFRFNLGTTF
jgi:outer membrane protein insertion porin family